MKSVSESKLMSDKRAIFIHGAGGGSWEWQLWQPVFEAWGIESIAIDLEPNANGLENTRFEDYRQQVQSVATEGDTLIGASLGGLIAMATHDVAARVLINPMPPLAMIDEPAAKDLPAIIPWSTLGFRSHQRSMGNAYAATVLATHGRWRDESGRVLTDAFNGIVAHPDGTPTVVMASELDEDIPAQTSMQLALNWKADLWQLRGETHLSPLLGRNATTLAERVARFMLDI